MVEAKRKPGPPAKWHEFMRAGFPRGTLRRIADLVRGTLRSNRDYVAEAVLEKLDRDEVARHAPSDDDTE